MCALRPRDRAAITCASRALRLAGAPHARERARLAQQQPLAGLWKLQHLLRRARQLQLLRPAALANLDVQLHGRRAQRRDVADAGDGIVVLRLAQHEPVLARKGVFKLRRKLRDVGDAPALLVGHPLPAVRKPGRVQRRRVVWVQKVVGRRPKQGADARPRRGFCDELKEEPSDQRLGKQQQQRAARHAVVLNGNVWRRALVARPLELRVDELAHKLVRVAQRLHPRRAVDADGVGRVVLLLLVAARGVAVPRRRGARARVAAAVARRRRRAVVLGRVVEHAGVEEVVVRVGKRGPGVERVRHGGVRSALLRAKKCIFYRAYARKHSRLLYARARSGAAARPPRASSPASRRRVAGKPASVNACGLDTVEEVECNGQEILGLSPTAALHPCPTSCSDTGSSRCWRR